MSEPQPEKALATSEVQPSPERKSTIDLNESKNGTLARIQEDIQKSGAFMAESLSSLSDTMSEFSNEIRGIVQETRREIAEALSLGKSPNRLILGLEIWKKLQISGDAVVENREILKKIPKDAKIIFAPSHLTNHDLLIATYDLCKDFDLAITDESTHHHITQEPSIYLDLALTGFDNYFPIDYVFDKKESSGKRGVFNPENYFPMKEAMEKQNKAMIIAVHSPSPELGIMPDKGGIADVYLAQITENTVIVPMAVNIDFPEDDPRTEDNMDLKSFTSPPTAKIIYGEPIRFEKIPGIEKMRELAKKNEEKTATPEEHNEFIALKKALRDQATLLMYKIAELLPAGKRGKWTKIP